MIIVYSLVNHPHLLYFQQKVPTHNMAEYYRSNEQVRSPKFKPYSHINNENKQLLNINPRSPSQSSFLKKMSTPNPQTETAYKDIKINVLRSSQAKETKRAIKIRKDKSQQDEEGKNTIRDSEPDRRATETFSKEESSQKQGQSCQNYFLRKTILILYKFFERQEKSWKLYDLTYRQLLVIMKELKYLRYSDEQSFAQQSKGSLINEELKKCYYLWINISQGKSFSLVNLVIILCCLENLEYDRQLIEDIVQELSKGISKFQEEIIADEPHFIFFTKREGFTFENGVIKPTKRDIEKIQTALKSFKYTKMMQNHPKLDFEDDSNQPELCAPSLSKKTQELATNKRQKILRDIKQKQPQVENIELYHILTYKEDLCRSKNIKTENYDSFQPSDKGKANKENLKMLAKPKTNPTEYTADESQYLKNKQEYTFQPNVHSSKPKKGVKQQQGAAKKQNYYQKCIKQRQFESKYKSNKEPQRLQKLKRTNKSSGVDNFCQFPAAQVTFQDKNKHQIIDELQWEEIPKQLEEISLENELFGFRDEFKLEMPLFQPHLPLCQNEKEKKRRQYLDLPILYVDVNIQEGKKERIVIYDGDKAKDLAIEFGKKHDLSADTVSRLEGMLQQQIGSVLAKIDQAVEEDCSYLY